MRNFLSIIIPKYKETEKELFHLLSSINEQIGIDFSDIEVIIVTDGGGTALDKDFLSLFDFSIRQASLNENKGPGIARQTGLDLANGEYVMFCDADDILHNAGVLGALMQEAEKTVPDILSTSWLEEILDENGKYRYITHENENTWMHGKLLRRQFLSQNSIRFHENLRVHEDSYFLCIAAALSKRSAALPFTSYVWKYHPESITRKNGAAYAFESIPEFIRACSMAHKEVERLAPEQMEYKILQFTMYSYFSFHRPEWQEKEHAMHRKAAEDTFKKHISPFWHYWVNAPRQAISTIYNQERIRGFLDCVEDETIWEWIKRLGLKQ